MAIWAIVVAAGSGERLGADRPKAFVRLGGRTMLAQIQLPNVRFFEQLGWRADGPAGEYHGVMHQPMAIPLRPRDRRLRPGR